MMVKIINEVPDVNIDFIKEHMKDFDTSLLDEIVIKDSKSFSRGRFRYNFYGLGSKIIILLGKSNKYPDKFNLYKRKNAQKDIILCSKQEALEFIFYHEFYHYVQWLLNDSRKESEADAYSIKMMGKENDRE